MRHFNVVVADDERTIREGLAHYVPWEELGYHLIGCAKNAPEAASYFDTEDIHLLVTDIEMPGQNGLTLVESLIQKGKKPAVVIISGYDCFEYAQKAVKLGVIYDYVLKPIAMKQFTETLTRIHDQLTQAHEQISLPTLSNEDFTRMPSDGNGKLYSQFRQIEKYMLARQSEEAVDALSSVIQALDDAGIPLKIQQRHIIAFLLSTSILLYDNSISLSDVFGSDDPVSHVLEITEKADLFAYIQGSILTTVRLLDGKNKPSSLVGAAIRIAHQQYSSPDFSLHSTAEQLLISPNYLSTKFKQETGHSFSHYVNSLRIQRACVLLEDTRNRVSDVAEMVGIEDVRYFTRLFKKQTGYTPGDYRNQI